jgi:hypothetical protein
VDVVVMLGTRIVRWSWLFGSLRDGEGGAYAGCKSGADIA